MFQEVYNISHSSVPALDEMATKDVLGFAVQVITILVAILAVRSTYREYKKQGREKRAEQYLKIRRTYRENELFQKIVVQAHGDKDFTNFNQQQRIEYMAFFEDMQFLINSGLIKPDVVYYMFGSDMIRAWDSDFCVIWDAEKGKESDVRSNPNFTLLKNFVEGAREFKNSDKIVARIEKAKL